MKNTLKRQALSELVLKTQLRKLCQALCISDHGLLRYRLLMTRVEKSQRSTTQQDKMPKLKIDFNQTQQHFGMGS